MKTIKNFEKYIKEEMTITLGEDGLDKTYQGKFPKETECCHSNCNGTARIGFVTQETNSPYLADMYDNDPKGEGYWLHDACSVAIYFCKECLNPTALYNQA